jgi:hypothetical protein
MVLINMMMAIINMSFEEIKENATQYESKFQLIAFIKRTAKELYGKQYATPYYVKYQDDDDSDAEDKDKKSTTEEFAGKTDAFLKYVEETFLDTAMAHDEESKALNAKAKASMSNETAKKQSDVAFDALFSDKKASDA